MKKGLPGVSLWWSGFLVALLTSAAVAWYSTRPADPGINTASFTKRVPPAVTLDQEQREFLWNVEQSGLRLGKYGFSVLAEGIREGSEPALAALLSGDFEGALLDLPPEVHAVNDFSEVVRTRAADHPLKTVGPGEFVDQLLRYRSLFAQSPEVQLSLMTLAPIDRSDAKGLWRGTCKLRIWGEREPGRPGEVELYLDYQILNPTEGTLESRGWLKQCSIHQSLVGTANAFLLHDVAAERGVDVEALHDNWKADDLKVPPASSGGVYLADYNRDGFTDMLVTDIGLKHGFVLYRGLPEGRFEDVTSEVRLPPLPDAGAQSASFVDLDDDGWQDLLLAGRTFRNKQGREFIDVSSIHEGIPPEVSAIAAADFDRDGRMDLYLTYLAVSESGSWVSEQGNRSPGNRLWRNLGDWRFQDVTEQSAAQGGNRSVFTALWLDTNNDRFPDLYVIDEFGNGVLLVNDGDGTFSEASLIETGYGNYGDFGTMGATCGDVDNDGNVDLYLAQMYSKAGKRVIGNLREGTYSPEVMGKLRRLVTGSQLYLNRGDQTFDRVGDEKQVAAVGWAYGPALVDLDNDGWLDIHATCGYISRSRGKPDG